MEKPPSIEVLAKDLQDPKCNIGKRMRSVFFLKLHGGKDAIDALAGGLVSDSVLLNHEICYVLGQMQDPQAIPILNDVLQNEKEDPVVRHEAAEALGAIGLESSIELLKKYESSSVVEVAETCRLAIDTIKHKIAQREMKEKEGTKKSVYLSVDPAPPEEGEKTLKELEDTLVDAKKSLFERYRAMFALRDMGTKEAVIALAKAFQDKSAIVRHEIAYVMGQMRREESVPFLKEILKKNDEHEMVRHEAAEALGSIATSEATKILEGYAKDQQRIVKESCLVALDIAEDWGTTEVNEQ
mmetsp:Transcript_30837/g.75203  ORF Transcript_30837/g.75203 Transcript_30837/m.75203 type:complete len:298 (-) Transcript_30837:173-1066(-)|eukprot:CAMPEP_0114525030 /NCGR_PEP_ID=MMETSP0109-20121206/22189_1 /TAXON_ID=29199 /ORGANISM="Chlorarachnion reptans, Strain CCCM449" /LENGTH=297 /DNA_ID=CAMNT_0001706549 /DNA_START=241 /DNA_END=1134 /DNA_ORIENTATION=-